MTRARAHKTPLVPGRRGKGEEGPTWYRGPEHVSRRRRGAVALTLALSEGEREGIGGGLKRVIARRNAEAACPEQPALSVEKGW